MIGSRGTVEIDPRDTMARTLWPAIGRELPLSAAPESHVAVMSPEAKGKIVLVP